MALGDVIRRRGLQQPKVPAVPGGTTAGPRTEIEAPGTRQQPGQAEGYREQPTEYDSTNPGERQTETAPTASKTAYAGWDQAKWDDPNHQTLKYQVGRLMSAYGDMANEANRNAFIQALQKQFPGAEFNGKDKIRIPGTGEGYGNWIDVFGAAGAGEYRPQWLDTSYEPGGANYQAPAGGTTGGFLPPTSPAASSWTDPNQSPGEGWVRTASGAWVPSNHPQAAGILASSSTTTQGPNPNRKAYQDRIAELLETPLTVDAASLAETPEAQAAQMARQRSEERMRGQLMERAAVDGYTGGAVDAEMAGIRQGLAENEIGLMAELATSKMMENRERVLAAIQLAQSDNNFEQEQALRRELAALDAAIQRESISAGLTDNAADRGLRRELGLLGIGYNYDALQAQMNQAAMQAMLDGYR